MEFYKYYSIRDIGWLFICIFIFGINEFIVKKLFVTDKMYVVWYLLILMLGIYILYTTHQNTDSNKNSNKNKNK